MQLDLGRKGDYAVRAVLCLALRYEGGRTKAREIAEDMAIPENYLPQVLNTVVRAGIVGSVAGPDGGYYLLRPPAEISVLQVIEAAEGPVISDACAVRDVPCGWNGNCVLHDDWFEAKRAFTARLAAADFETLATKEQARRGLGEAPAEVAG